MAGSDAPFDSVTALLPSLLGGLDVLADAGRHLHPPRVASLATELAPLREPLADQLAVFSAAARPQPLHELFDQIEEAGTLALRAFDEFAGAPESSQPVFAAYRALGYATKATEALYPLSMVVRSVSQWFLEPGRRTDEDLLSRLAEGAGNAGGEPRVGVLHAANDRSERGGFSLYVPETYDGRPVPLVVALHGGHGHGRSFLWTWLRAARSHSGRSHSAIVLSPTSTGDTWSLMDPEVDSANLDAMVGYVCERWSVDPERVLLTGMSDGGTFSYVTGMRSDTPFTHLAPCSASFHPMLLAVADADKLAGLPIYLMHGVLDWMFPVEVARAAHAALISAGADVVYRELDDLSHTYPTEENPLILDWLTRTG